MRSRALRIRTERLNVTAPHRRTRLLPTFVIGVATVLAMAVGAAPASAATYKKCSLTQREQQPGGTKPKPTYNLSLRQQRTSCTTAKRVMKAFHACRALTSYRCTKKVLSHWSCTGRKTSSAAGIFVASYTCTWGSRRVRGTYQQNTPSA
jgi:hypothetical protein